MEFPFSIPVTELPSRGLTYGGITKINARPLLVREGKILRAALDNRDYYQMALTTNKILKKVTDIDPDIITHGDKFFLLLWLRIQTLGETFLVNFKCGPCRKRTEGVPVKLNELKVKYLDPEYKHPTYVSFEENGKKGIMELSIHTGKDEETVVDFMRKSDFKTSEDIFARYATSIRKINDKEISFEKAIALMSTAKDGGNFINLIKTFFELYDHGVDMHTPITCPKCKEASTVLIPFRSNLFEPPAFSKDDFRKSIVAKPKN